MKLQEGRNTKAHKETLDERLITLIILMISKCRHMPKPINLYTLNKSSVLYVNNIKKKKQKIKEKEERK